MALSAPLERLQPCLFDRLIDEDPSQKQESRTARVMSMSRYREGVLRDLAWLLNCAAHTPDEGLAEFPEVERSVFNYGKRGLSGLVASTLETVDLENELMQTIHWFEPRIVKETLDVRAVNAGGTNPNLLAFEISGELWAQPFPEKLYLKTSLDLESGLMQL